jgi:aminopeptidase N
VTAWAFPQDTAYARTVFARVPQMVDLYVSLFGPFPFEKLANVQSSTRFGGMENASVIFYSERAIAGRADFEGTVAHEVVHQWFGDSVTPADWPHLWLSEGFADYFGALFWAQTQDDAAFRERIDAMRARYLASTTTDRPVVDDGITNLLQLLNDNSYEKGALVLHMLRGIVGERAFFPAIRQFYSEHAGGHAETADLQRVMEEVSGQSLGWFFDQWLRRPGHPVVRVEWTWSQELSQAQVTLTQVQDALWPTFRMPVDFEFVMEGGVHRVSEWVDGRVWRREIALPARPTELRIDPDGWLILEQATTP